MSASIVMAWKDKGDLHRRDAYEFVTAYWRHHLPEVELVIDPGPEPFRRSTALNAAIRRAAGDVLLELGPDCIIRPEFARSALKLAGKADGLVVAHRRYVHLSKAQTSQLLALGPERALEFRYAPSRADDFGTTSVDVAAFSRATWEIVRGYDERFGVWGADDGAFALACDVLAGPTRRVPGDWLHLWHPRLPQSYPGHPGYTDQHLLVLEYHRAAEAGPAAMRELLDRR